MKLATLSFDDGHERDRGVIAVLDRFGIKATFYIIAQRTGRLDAAVYAGHEAGSHTFTHPRRGLNETKDLSAEVIAARPRLQKWSGQEVKPFAYPCGKATLRYAEVVGIVGHTMARTYAIDPENAYQIPEPFLVPVTAYLDRPIDYDALWNLRHENKPIHLAGHGQHFCDTETWQSLHHLCAWLQAGGYEFVVNSEFVERCQKDWSGGSKQGGNNGNA